MNRDDIKELNDLLSTMGAVDADQASLLDKIAEFFSKPLDVFLTCPNCGHPHVDAPDLTVGWTNPPHRSHTCASCNIIWTPCALNTNGVAYIEPGQNATWKPGDQTLIAAKERSLASARTGSLSLAGFAGLYSTDAAKLARLINDLNTFLLAVQCLPHLLGASTADIDAAVVHASISPYLDTKKSAGPERPADQSQSN